MEYKIISRKEIYNHRFIYLEEAKVCLDRYDGKEMLIERLAFVRPEVVAILLYNPTKNVFVLTEQFRYSTIEVDNGWVLEIVAGVMDQEEEGKEETAFRECMEETGYKPSKLTYVQMFMPSVGISNQKLHFFYAEVEEADRIEKGGGLEEETEDIKVIEMPLDEMRKMLDRGEIYDVKTLTALQWFFLKRRSERN